MKTTAFVLAILSASEALLCYQGRYNASDPVKGSPQVCLGNSVSCVTGFDIKENIAVRFCDTSNCTENMLVTSSPECWNFAVNGIKMAYCCCHVDGCNNKWRNENGEFVGNAIPGPEEDSLARSIANRIEGFYEHDAVPSERTFIRRVVQHIFDHIDVDKEGNVDDERKGKW